MFVLSLAKIVITKKKTFQDKQFLVQLMMYKCTCVGYHLNCFFQISTFPLAVVVNSEPTVNQLGGEHSDVLLSAILACSSVTLAREQTISIKS